MSKTNKNSRSICRICRCRNSSAEYTKRRKSQLQAIKNAKRDAFGNVYQMILGRRFEEKCAEVYRMGKIGGFVILYRTRSGRNRFAFSLTR